MSQSLSKILVHVVFSTKDRRPYLNDRELRTELHAYLGGILARLDCQSLIVGGVADHVHALSTLARTRTAADVVKELKRGSTLWVKAADSSLAEFAWQGGYGAFSIGQSQLNDLRHYIANQREHHHRTTFQEEFRHICQCYGIELDERYAWD